MAGAALPDDAVRRRRARATRADAYRVLGDGLRALQALELLPSPVCGRRPALRWIRTREPLKLTFDEADVELLSKLMQGTDEKYRFSAALPGAPGDDRPRGAAGVLAAGRRRLRRARRAPEGVVVLPSAGARPDRPRRAGALQGGQALDRSTAPTSTGDPEVQLGPAASRRSTATGGAARPPPCPAAPRSPPAAHPLTVGAHAAERPPHHQQRGARSARASRSPRVAVNGAAAARRRRAAACSGSSTVTGTHLGRPTTASWSGCTATAPPCAASRRRRRGAAPADRADGRRCRSRRRAARRRVPRRSLRVNGQQARRARR